MKKIFLLLFVITGILKLQAKSPNAFIGNIHFQVTGNENVDMKFATKDWFTAINISMNKKENVRMILDLQKNNITILTEAGPNGKMGIVTKLDDLPLDNLEKADANVKIEKTNEKKSILGYECTKYIVTTDDGVAECWITEKIKFNPFENFGKMGGNQSGKLISQDAFKNMNGLAMETKYTDKSNKVTHIKVISIDQNKPAESVFSTAGYEIMDLSNFPGMKNMGK